MNAQHQYTCPGARANSQIGLAARRRRRSLSRARKVRWAVERPRKSSTTRFRYL